MRYALLIAVIAGDGRALLTWTGWASNPPAPRVRVGRPKASIDGEPVLALPVTCSAACDVRAQVGEAEGAFSSTGTVSLARAGSAELRVYLLGDLLLPRRSMQRIRVRYGARGALESERLTRTLHVRLGSGPPLPRVAGATAHREGDDVVVTWRTRTDARRDAFFAYLVERPGEPALVTRAAMGGPRRFTVRFKHRPTGTSVVILTGDDQRGIVRRTRVAVL